MSSLTADIKYKPWIFPYHYKQSHRTFLGSFATCIFFSKILWFRVFLLFFYPTYHFFFLLTIWKQNHWSLSSFLDSNAAISYIKESYDRFLYCIDSINGDPLINEGKSSCRCLVIVTNLPVAQESVQGKMQTWVFSGFIFGHRSHKHEYNLRNKCIEYENIQSRN